ncbi:MAG: hypothetical protein Q7S29_06055 [Candidatus Peribacter sp.]|nr:hypothetical protein [Candidatus Peribacter sp.]
MVQLQEHVKDVLQRIGVTPKEFLAVRSPIRHAIGYMINAYNRDDDVEGEKIFAVCEEHLTEGTGGPSCEENMEPLAILRGVRLACESLLSNRRNQQNYRQAIHVSKN